MSTTVDESVMKATTSHTVDDLPWSQGKVTSETLPQFRHPELGSGQTRIATLKYPWGSVVHAYESRFPRNPLFPYIENTEVLESEQSEHVKREVRRLSIDPGMPGWLKTFARIKHFVFIEESIVDYQKRMMTLNTRNESLVYYTSVQENCVYRQHPENEQWTLKEQTGYYKLHTYLFGWEKSIENYGSWIFVERAKHALQQEMTLIEQLLAEGKVKN